MKIYLAILLFSLLLCGCSQAQQTPSSTSFDRIQAGKDVSFGGDTLRVDKRAGTSVEGVRIVSKDADGQVTTTTAKTGTLSPGTDRFTFKLTLKDAVIEKPKQKMTCGSLILILPAR
jgi:hypothetical protein